MRGARRAFTLIELLVVIAVISVLMGFLIPALGRVRIRTQRAAAHARLLQLQTALATYNADYRRFPRLAPRSGTNDELLQDDGPALYAALMNKPTVEAGGGRGAPYTGWDDVGKLVDRSRLQAATMGWDGVTGAERLPNRTDAELTAVQLACGPRSATPLVFLDAWGNPIHYREWDSIGEAREKAILDAPPLRTGFPAESPLGGDNPIPGPLPDVPHSLEGVELWSNGPNGVNEGGEGDDVCTWRPI